LPTRTHKTLHIRPVVVTYVDFHSFGLMESLQAILRLPDPGRTRLGLVRPGSG